ncbi:MAG TPA: hypothetical protein VHD84_03645 [Candidatus Saccharimonadales bacterium]|nr:hypothetical protein [Candidatus Saccharimonadales bacterium]
MTSVLIMGFLAGALVVNGLPHIVSGASGKTRHTPFGDSSSAAANVVWGWLNWVVAVLLWHVAPMRFHPRATFVAAAIGALVSGLALASAGEKQPRRSRKA